LYTTCLQDVELRAQGGVEKKSSKKEKKSKKDKAAAAAVAAEAAEQPAAAAADAANGKKEKKKKKEKEQAKQAEPQVCRRAFGRCGKVRCTAVPRLAVRCRAGWGRAGPFMKCSSQWLTCCAGGKPGSGCRLDCSVQAAHTPSSTAARVADSLCILARFSLCLQAEEPAKKKDKKEKKKKDKKVGGGAGILLGTLSSWPFCCEAASTACWSPSTACRLAGTGRI